MIPELVGRTRERAAVHHFLDLIKAGPSAMAISGESGTGKSALWRSSVREAEAAGLYVLSCRNAGGPAQAFTGLSELLGPYLGWLAVALPAPEALPWAAWSAPAPAALSPSRLGPALRDALTVMAADRPTLVAIDDLHHLDGGSALALASALAGLGDSRLGVLWTTGSQEPGGAPHDLARALGGCRRQSIRLGALPERQLNQVIHAHLGYPMTASTIRRIHAATNGNPRWALETASLLEPDARLGPFESVPVPAGLRQELRSQLQPLPEAASRLLLVAAEAAHPTVRLLEQWCGPAADITCALNDATRAGVLRLIDDRVEFCHPVMAEVIRSQAPSPLRLQAHRRLAELARDPVERGRHLAFGADGSERCLAGELRNAAAEAARRGETATAAELYESAAGYGEDPQLASRDRVLAAGAYTRAGDLGRAIVLLEHAAAAERPGCARAELLHQIGRLRCHSLATAAAVAAYEQAEDEAGDHPRLLAVLALDRAWAHYLAGELPAALRQARRGVTGARLLRDRQLLCQALATRAFLDFAAGHGVSQATLRLAVTDRTGEEWDPFGVRPSVLLAGVLGAAGHAGQAAALLRADQRRAEAIGDDSTLALVLAALAELTCRHGDLAGAEILATQADHTLLAAGHIALRPLTLGLRAESHALLGQEQLARGEIAEGLALAARSPLPGMAARLRAVLGHLELSLGNAAAAHAQLAPLTSALPPGLRTDPALLRFVPDHVEALILLGDTEAAAALLAPFGERAARLRRRPAVLAAQRCQALLLTASGQPEAALRALLGALAVGRPQDEPVEYGRCLLAAGRIRRRLRQKKATAVTLEDALGVFSASGARLWADQARAEIARIGRHASAGELAPTERRTAELAAQGLTNREIAHALFVSVKTVDATLCRVYKKLAIRSRTELAWHLLAARPRSGTSP